MDAESAGGARVWDAVFTGEPPGLLLTPRPGVLDAPSVRAALSAAIDAASIGAAAAPAAESRPDPGRLRILEGVALLWHDRWDEAHGIAQSREGERDFDLLHAILHRREGDFANAAYWFRAAGKHPCYSRLEKAMEDALPRGGLRSSLLPDGRWSPAAFVAAVRALRGEAGAATDTLKSIQAGEFRAFADWLLR